MDIICSIWFSCQSGHPRSARDVEWWGTIPTYGNCANISGSYPNSNAFQRCVTSQIFQVPAGQSMEGEEFRFEKMYIWNEFYIYDICEFIYVCLHEFSSTEKYTCRWSHCAGVWRITWTSTSCFGTYRTVGRSAEGEEGWEQEGGGKDRWCRERSRWGGSGERSTYCLPGWPTGHFI